MGGQAPASTEGASGGGDAHVVEIREEGRPPRRVTVTTRVVIGRECEGVVVDDPRVSRRHLALDVGPTGLTVTDLESLNGTSVNDVPIDGCVPLGAGDRVRLGRVEIAVLAGPVHQAAPVRLAELQARPVDGAVIRFQPGTAGERAVPAMVAAIRRARGRLAGLGVDMQAVAPQLCLVDPFPDPRTGEMVTAGSVVDAERREIWMAVTAEAPPEAPERALALLLGAALPAASEIGFLLEGYGLAVSDGPIPDDELAAVDLPTLEDADGELRTAMLQSFVSFLIERDGHDAFRRLVWSARPGALDVAVHEVYGQNLSALEEAWRDALGERQPKVKLTQFLRLTARYLRPHMRREAEIFVYMVLALGFTTVFPFAMRRLFDSAIPRHSFGQVVQIVGALGIAFLVSLLAGLRRSYLSAYVSSAVTRDLRVDMFARLQALSTGWFGRQQEGDVLSRLFSDVGQLEAGISLTIREGVFQVLTVAVSAVVLVTLDPILGLVVIIGAPLVGLVYRAMASGAQRRSLAVQEELGSTYTVASENYGAQAVVKAFGLERREQDRFGRASERLFGREIKLQLFGAMFSLSVNMIVTVLQLIVLGLGSWLILHGRLTVGGLVAFTTMMGQVLSPVAALTSLGQQVQATTGSLMRINEVLDAQREIDDLSDAFDLAPLEREIQLDHVDFSYTADRATLEGITCTIPAGSRVAFVGPTGAGKSSVLQLIMRFYDVNAGAVLFDGHNVRKVTLASLRGQLGVVFQDTFLFDTTIRENIALGKPDATDAEIEAASRAAELHEFVETLPRGYGTLVGERGNRLSGGQRQRLALARALLRGPSVLLLDEATSALDPRTERRISATLERVGEGRTTIAVTHRLTSITEYDVIFVMSDGHLVERGTHAELLALGGVYAELWSEQTGGITPTDTPFDAVAALSAVHFFFGLGRDDLVDVATRLRAVDLAAGARFADNTGALAFVRRGRPRVLAPGLDGQLVAAAELRPGDAFGVAAVLGAETGAVLCADEPVELLLLDAEDLAALAARHPTVAAALMGEDHRVAPSGGQRLSRASLVMRSSRVQASAGERATPAGPRVSGAFTAVVP